ncbi:hypothetical protein [Alkalimarinus alittae]|uniref:Uncharacterized protein n=1 Tax=Alkalimarinus alittae TaxID=2961619 RepID=A0ABY6N4J0_9ALTE|nr:hypothetical protein [Alkalimarinus alittae]UZE96930.1 hypothetical protein NKI27_04040 [Alkalimarinus alittae]
MQEENYEVTQWLTETSWPTRQQDVNEMVYIYDEWKRTSPRCPDTGELDEELLIQMTLSRMRHIHPSQRDACVITALLVMQTAFVAKFEGVFAPNLTGRLH